MRRILDKISAGDDPNLIVGHNLADDAGVYSIGEDRALVQTVDFFPPIVDDPFDFGRIAAANALSDIYAMGAVPLTALNIAAFPEGDLPEEVLYDILRGGNEIAREAGAAVIGGHTVKDQELKYGLAVTGLIDPSLLVKNDGAHAGGDIILTKPLGSGILATALREDKLDGKDYDAMVDVMIRLNARASSIMVEFNAEACTDVTGYGLLGHALEMAEASGVCIEIFSGEVPVMRGAIDHAAAGMLTGGGNTNREFLEGKMEISGQIDENLLHVLFDPQTSGGLLIAALPGEGAKIIDLLKTYDPQAAVIGRAVPYRRERIAIK